MVVCFLVVEFTRFQSDGRLIKGAVQSAVMNNASDNYNEIFDGTKTSVFANITFNDSSGEFEFIDDEGDFYKDMKESLNIVLIDGEYCKVNNYCISIDDIDIQSTELIVGTQEKYTITIYYTVRHFWKGGFKNLPPINYEHKLIANYIPKY